MGSAIPDADRQGAHHRRDQAAGVLTEPSLRRATERDQVALLELERAAYLAALAHVFGPYPYPDDDVLARWSLVLADPTCTTLVLDAPGHLDGLVAVDESSVRHLAVHPSRWGQGLGRVLLTAGVTLVDRPATLWCLESNTRARGLYEHCGWQPTGERRESVFPPHPGEMEYALA